MDVNTLPPSSSVLSAPTSPEALNPQVTNVKPPSIFKKHKYLTVGLLLIMFLGLIVFGANIFTRKKLHKILPYETTVIPTSPKEKFQQVIANNPIYAQINMISTPTIAVDGQHNQGAQTMLALKAALSATDPAPESQKQQVLISLDGTLSAPDSEETQSFSLKGSLLQLLQNNGAKSVSDFILNGSVGVVRFDDENQDALHISFTQTDFDNSYLKVHLSDFLLIYIDKIIHPEKIASPSISVDTNDIWPFLGQYLHIARSAESLRFGDNLSQENQDRLQLIRTESASVFQKTFGDIESYLDITESNEGSATTIFTATVVPEKLAMIIADYVTGLQTVRERHLEDFKLLCEFSSTNQVEKDGCLTELETPAYPQENIAGEITLILSPFQFEPIQVTIDNNTLAVKDFSFGITTPQLFLHIDTNLLEPDEKPILGPENSVSLLSAGNNTDSFTDITYQEQSIQGDLYRENKQLLLASYDDTRYVCGGLPGQEYCLDFPSLWENSLDSSGTTNTLWLMRKNLDPADYRTASISIRQDTTSSFSQKCIYEEQSQDYGIKMINYFDITTGDGLPLRLSEPENNFDSEIAFYYICSARDSIYYTTTPYGNFSVDPGSLSFQDLADELEPILTSLSLTNPVGFSQLLAPSPSPKESTSYSFSTPVKKLPAGDDMWVLFYGTRGGDPGVCYTKSLFLQQKYQVDNEAVFVVPPGYGVCIQANLCAVCTNGKLAEPTSDLSTCAEQICQ